MDKAPEALLGTPSGQKWNLLSLFHLPAVINQPSSLVPYLMEHWGWQSRTCGYWILLTQRFSNTMHWEKDGHDPLSAGKVQQERGTCDCQPTTMCAAQWHRDKALTTDQLPMSHSRAVCTASALPWGTQHTYLPLMSWVHMIIFA